MTARAPKRTFSQAALNAWFERLQAEWEPFFSPEELEGGRNVYREDAIREIELGRADAIIRGQVNNRKGYAVVDWDEKLSVRSSVEKAAFGRMLAAGGLYAIEELVADEAAAGLPAESEPEPEKPLAAEVPPAPGAARPERPLRLRLASSSRGLILRAFWNDGDGKSSPLFSLRAGKHASLTPQERENQIRLTGMARKAGFVSLSRGGGYLLSDLPRIPEFLNKELPEWKRRFRVEIEPDVARLARGPQTVAAGMEAAPERNGGVSMRLKLRAAHKWLTAEQGRRLLRGSPGTVILPEMGMLRIPEEQAGDLLQWHSITQENDGAPLPKYMIFSVFGTDMPRLALSADLQRWRDELLQAPEADIPLPGFLRPYQKRGTAWLARMAAAGCHPLLADEMGLGKTVQALALLDSCPLPGLPHLIVCPASVIPVWRGEAARFYSDMRVETLKNGHDFLNCPGPAVWLSSYTQLRRHKHLLGAAQFGYAILDEAQFIKNPDAKVTRACFSIRARRRLVLTGTPLENRQMDLWTLFRFLMPGLLGKRRLIGEAWRQKDGGALAERLRRQVAPFILRRTKNEVLPDLPPKAESVLPAPMTDPQMKEYSRLARLGMERLGDDLETAARRRAMSFFTLLTRLRQVCCDPGLLPWSRHRPIEESGKIRVLTDKLRSLFGEKRKVVIFSQFVSFLERARLSLAREFPEVPVHELTGKTADRVRPVESFQNGPGPRVILVSLRAGGAGITLHAADYVFLLDPWWNPAAEKQAVDRAHRIGQDKPVFIYRLVAPGTIEERIETLKAGKRELFDELVGGLADMSDLRRHYQSIRSLIELRTGG